MEPERWQRVKEVCADALELDGDQRPAFVARVCSGDPALAAEVEELLRHSPALGSFLEAMPALPPSRAPDRPPDVDDVVRPGDTILHYAIAEKIGEGGMGVVYRAEDTRLGRSVALKFLPGALARDSQALERFHREARAISALNHPRVCTLFDVGQHEGRTFLVLEYLEGQTLAARLESGPLPLHRALELGIQIADGLEAAHAHDIVHRDLKPGNVMVTAAGAKLLDFGLAKFTSTSMPSAAATSVTHPAVIPGTVPYMAPEQLEGKPVDARTDIWALGAILYEMVAGRRAFDAPSQASLIASILDHEPPGLARVAPAAPLLLEQVVAKCLAKPPHDRWGSARDVAQMLQWVRDGHTGVPGRRGWRTWRIVASLALMGLALVMLAGVLLRTGPPRTPPPFEPARPSAASRRFTITLPAAMPLAPGALLPEASDRPVLALSRDGARLVYVAKIGETIQLCVRDMSSTGAVVALPGTEGGHSPFFSPDGAYVGFFAEGKLKKTPTSGGAIVTLADAPNPYGATWADDDWIYFTRQAQEGIQRVKADGSGVEGVTSVMARMPELLQSPGRMLTSAGDGTYVIDAAARTRRLLLRGFGARIAAPSHVIYALPGRLMAAAFDARQGVTAGSGIELASDLRTGAYGVAQFAFALDGTLVYVPGHAQTLTSLVRVDRHGRAHAIGLPEATFSTFDLSRDGTRLVYGLESAGGQVTEIWQYDLQRRRKASLTPRVTAGEAAWNAYPRWTPDGQGVVFFRKMKDRPAQLVLQLVDQSAAPVEVWTAATPSAGALTPASFTPGGDALIAFGPIGSGGGDIVRFSRDPSGGSMKKNPEVVLATPYSENWGRVSPDGRWMLFTSDQSGRNEVYVTSYPVPGVLHKVSRDGGHKAAWNGSSEIVYKVGMEMYSVAVTTGAEFHAATPTLLFTGAFPNIPGFDFAVFPRGREFLMLQNPAFVQSTTTLTVITNVLDELERRAPSGRR